MNNNEKNDSLIETSTSLTESASIENEVINYDQLSELEKIFNCDQKKLKPAINSAFEKILSKAEPEKDKEHLKKLITESEKYISEKQRNKDNKFVHGTGTDALFGIIEKGKIIRRGSEFGGADVEMGHQIDKKDGKNETYTSVSENQTMGMALSYFYARGFARPETINTLNIDANQINQSNVVLEAWDNLSEKEQKRLNKEYNFSRETLEKISERPHYFEPAIEEDKIFVYQSILERLKNNKLPKAPEKYIKMPEVHHLYGNVTNNEIIEKIMLAISSALKKYPDSIESFVNDFENKLERTKSRLEEYKKLSPNEQKRKTHQLPVILTIKKEGIKNFQKTKIENGTEKPIHPSGQERRIYEDVDIKNISEIQVPEKIIPELKRKIKEKIDSTKDPETSEHLKNIKIVPLEFYEIERIVRKEVNKRK